ncbi:MAG TPA: DNA repair protein RecN [Aequorivita sp.]|nr:DNA repair protein RecN [Aequorivita sp.]
MLTTLAIKNFALIEDIRVDLGQGLTVITGETGAGKSILLGAMALLLGKRADLSSVKDVNKKCIVEGHFSIGNYDLKSIFDDNDMDYDPQTILRREILPSGKSRAFVNDSPVGLAQLQVLAPYLVDIHSQGETIEIVSESFQLTVIDAIAENSKNIETYSRQLQEYKEIVKNLNTLKLQKEAESKELDYNTFLFEELQQANLKGLNQEELEETFDSLNNAEAIQEALAQSVMLLSEEQIGSVETAKEARIILSRIKSFSSTFDAYWQRLNSIIIELEDFSEEMQNTGENLAADPEMLVQVNEKLQLLYKLQQKHSLQTVAELVELQDELEEKLNITLGLDARIKELEKQSQQSQLAASTTADEIHKNRKKAIPELKRQLEEILLPLGLPNAQFQFELTASKDFKLNGTDSLDLLFTANKGMPLGSLKKVASGGEMSRIMLAIKSVLAKYTKLPTLVLDEIDTGVSGEIAKKMADIMFQIGKTMQVLSITHLPQIAAKGEHHLKIYKEDIQEVTVTHLKNLTEEERIVEIAKMLGGEKFSDAAIANAKELLN